MTTARLQFVLYDGRACGGAGTEDSVVFAICDSEEEARSYQGLFGEWAMACYSYRVLPPLSSGGNERLVDEKWEWDWRP